MDDTIRWQAFCRRMVIARCLAVKTAKPVLTAEYISDQATGMARAFCPAGTTVLGGGGFVEGPVGAAEVKLRQSHPISDATGVIAYGTTTIGWQAASSDFADTVVAFAICGTR